MTAVQSAWALIGTGLIYNRKEIFESLNASEALVDFAVPAFFGAMVFGQIVTGLVARMFSHATMIAAGCFGMMAACLMVLMESPYSALIGFLTFGFAQGIFIVVGQSLWADFFGRSHIGKIRGLVWMIVVCASSLGGFALTLGEDAATRFQPIQIAAIVLAGLFFACLFIRKPKLPNEPEQVEQE